MTWLTNSMRFGGGNPDPYWANVVFYLPMLAPGAAPVDVSPLARTVTVTGTPGGYTADAGLFAGQTAYQNAWLETDPSTKGLTVPAVAGANLDGDFTIEGWFLLTLLSGDRDALWKQYNAAESLSFGPVMQASGLNESPSLITEPNFLAGAPLFDAGRNWTGEVADHGRWHHYAVDRTGGVLRLYMDGQPMPWTGTQSTDWNGPLRIGHGTGLWVWRGYIGPQRVTKGVARYQGVPFVPGVTADGWMTETAPDFSGTAAEFWRIRWTASNAVAPYGREAELRATPGGANVAVSASALPTYAASSGTAANPFKRDWKGSTWTPSLPAWAKADLKAAFKLLHLRIRNGNTANRAPRTWSLEGSNDDSSWTTLISRADDTGWQRYEARSYHIADQGSFRYYRFNVTAVDGGTSPAIEEIYLAPSGEALSYISDPRMLGTAWDINWGRPRSAMFDGGTGVMFASVIKQGWVGVRLLSAQDITEITWTSDSGNPTATPSAGFVERSRDGVRWQTVWPFSGWTSWTAGETKVSAKP